MLMLLRRLLGRTVNELRRYRRCRCRSRCRARATCSVHAAQVFLKVLESRETFAAASLAIWMRTEHSFFWTAVLSVDLPLVPEKATAVSEALDFFASGHRADIWSFVLVHVFTIEEGSVTKFALVQQKGTEADFVTYFHSHLRLNVLVPSVHPAC